MADTVETLRVDLDATRADLNALRVEFDTLVAATKPIIDRYQEMPYDLPEAYVELPFKYAEQNLK